MIRQVVLARTPISQNNIADRAYFRALMSRPELTTILSEPLLNRVTGLWSTILARKLTDQNGAIVGVVLGSIELAHFDAFFGSLELGQDSSIVLFHESGILMVRHPRVEDEIGRNFKSAPVQKALRN